MTLSLVAFIHFLLFVVNPNYEVFVWPPIIPPLLLISSVATDGDDHVMKK